jgi:hypothetical protein
MTTLHAWTTSLERLRQDLEQVFGPRLRSLVAYDEHLGLEPLAPPPASGRDEPGAPHVQALALVHTLTFADLVACAEHARGWAKLHLAVPLLLTEDEFAGSLDAFPLEFAGMASHHLLVAGVDPFAGLAIDEADVRRACETQTKSHLIHLREGLVETHADAPAVARLVAASVPSFRALLVNLARLDGVAAQGREAVVDHAAARLDVPAVLLDQVLAIRRPADLDPSDALRVCTAYLDTVERLARLVDGWTAS